MTKTTQPGRTTDKVLTRRVPPGGRLKLTLMYPANEAEALRSFAQTIRLKGDRLPPLAVLGRRALTLYLDQMLRQRHSDSVAYSAEIGQLEALVTPIPQPARRHRPGSLAQNVPNKCPQPTEAEYSTSTTNHP